METLALEHDYLCAAASPDPGAPCPIDRTVAIQLNGVRQRLRICADDVASPPVLVVQAGPGLPLLHEVSKFQSRLALERDLAVGYWEQRGCGSAPVRDAQTVSLEQQVRDLRSLIRWTAAIGGKPPVLFGISLGASIALLAAREEPANVRAVVAVSPDLCIRDSDAAAATFLQAQAHGARGRRLAALTERLGAPPYCEPARFQLRARLLADAGGIETGRRFASLAGEFLWALLRRYGPHGAVMALRNMNRVQRLLLPELAGLDLFALLPCLSVPVYCILGERDPLLPARAARKLNTLAHATSLRVTTLTEAAHMAHFDRPAAVRAIVMAAALAHAD